MFSWKSLKKRRSSPFSKFPLISLSQTMNASLRYKATDEGGLLKASIFRDRARRRGWYLDEKVRYDHHSHDYASV
jgi:hypothetical protein